MNDALKNVIEKISGNLLGIGIQQKNLIESIDKNENIKICDLLDSADIKKEGLSGKIKKVYIKKFRKVFKKGRFDYIIANSKLLEDYYRYFVKDSIYINKNIIYIYIDKEYDYERLIKMYKRYNTNVKMEKYNDGVLIIIDASKSCDHVIKNKFYLIGDTVYYYFDKLGDYLARF